MGSKKQKKEFNQTLAALKTNALVQLEDFQSASGIRKELVRLRERAAKSPGNVGLNLAIEGLKQVLVVANTKGGKMIDMLDSHRRLPGSFGQGKHR